MKKYISMIALMIVLSLTIQSCGDDKKPETPKTEQSQEPAAVERNGEAPVAETPQEAEAAAEEAPAVVSTEPVISEVPKGLELKTYTTPIKGKIVSVTGLAMGNESITKAEAKKMVDKAVPLLFLPDVGGYCFVYNTDGSYAGKNLAKYAANKKIGIIGKVQVVAGVKVIIAEKIESMD